MTDRIVVTILNVERRAHGIRSPFTQRVQQLRRLAERGFGVKFIEMDDTSTIAENSAIHLSGRIVEGVAHLSPEQIAAAIVPITSTGGTVSTNTAIPASVPGNAASCRGTGRGGPALGFSESQTAGTPGKDDQRC